MTTPAYTDDMLAFGPVPSRRLGRSLGINNIPPKSCSYSCVYCQVGRTQETEIEPRGFYAPEDIVRAVSKRVEAVRRGGGQIDYLTFVPDGEPTLDNALGETISALRPLGIKIAVISNASLLWREAVRTALAKADWVSLKADAMEEATWRAINRPHPQLQLATVQEGMLAFAAEFTGELMSETMLVADVNDQQQNLDAVAAFLHRLQPRKAYLSVPTRPPAEAEVRPPTEEALTRAYATLSAQLPEVECINWEELTGFAVTDDNERDLLGITAVHPMREEAMRTFLAQAGLQWDFVQRLMDAGRLKEVTFGGRRFYVRRLPHVEGDRT
jgi:wyosine [tRNA(Phe)-imidazoG37] synthetase (radical SAM superfamily)